MDIHIINLINKYTYNLSETINMPKETKKKAEKTTPPNVTAKRGRGRPKSIFTKLAEETATLANAAIVTNPVTGISKDNEILKAIFNQQPEEPVISKKANLVLKQDSSEQYITNILLMSRCNKNYQHLPEEQERFDELSKLPAHSSKEDKTTLTKILSEILHVPLPYLKTTKKYGLFNQSDFIPTILCLERYFREQNLNPPQAPLPSNTLQPTEEKEQQQEQEQEQEEQEVVDASKETKKVEPANSVKETNSNAELLQVGEPNIATPIISTDAKEPNIANPIVTTDGEEPRRVFEEEPLEEPLATELTSIPNTTITIQNEYEKEQEQETVPNTSEISEYNKFLINKEMREHNNLKDTDSYDFLYPEINDPNFNIKIAKHKEFAETKYDGTIYDIEEYAKKLCNTDFELTPHQLFVKNFLSMQTPYNSLLLYHGLGTGKTCSSIGVAEEMRAYMKQVGITQPILVVASPNVQENYRLQLFDERKLKLESGSWNLNTCIGESLLREINPTNLIGVPKDRIISEINAIINKYYRFMGYIELANYIKRVIQIPADSSRFSAKELRELKVRRIKKHFDNRLIIIDEVHNIHISEQNKEDGKTATLLMDIARYTTSMRLLLLSATPMYNSYKEIIWLTNLINIVDKNSTIKESDIFDKDGNFKEKIGKNLEGGRELLTRKLTGYVSYIRGENPYTFPYRIYPDVFSPENSLSTIKFNYPTNQMNGREIEGVLENVPVFLTNIGEYQSIGYDFVIKHMRNKSNNTVNKFGEEREMPSFDNMESFGYTYLLKPLEALDIVFPNKELDSGTVEAATGEFEDQRNEEIINKFIGKTGLANTMKYVVQKSPYPNVYDFEYRPEILNDPNHGRIFHPDKIGKYSGKIAKICDCIKRSKGIVLIYSQYIEGSIIPIALALEEMGITRFSSTNYIKPLFKTPPTEPVDSITMKSQSQFLQDGESGKFSSAKYVMITGNKAYSPNNLEDIKYVTNPNNMNGEKVKVVIISKAGSEGLDFKCIRQVHILDPWYNMSRVEQIIGRGVRNFSHCTLEDFKERNVEIYLHSTIPRNDEEPADLYIYRYAEKKAKQIGKVTRVLKEIAVDCLLNVGQHNFTVDQLNTLANNKNMKIRTSSNPALINFQIGDRDYSEICDYTTCETEFMCSPNAEIVDTVKTTYNDDYAKMNYSSIVKRIRQLYKKKLFYNRAQLLSEINVVKTYPEDQIDFALSRFINNKNEYIYDEYGRSGYLINKDDIYAFQPIEITDENASVFDRSLPIDYKRSNLQLELEKPKIEDLAAIPEESSNEGDVVMVLYNQTLEKLNANMDNIEKSNLNKEAKKLLKETDWYINLGYVKEVIINNHNIDNTSLYKYATYHFLDTLELNEKLNILRYYYSGDKESFDVNEKYIQQYFTEKVVKVRGYNAIFFSNDKEEDEDNKKIFIQDNDNKWLWSNALPTDRIETLKQSVPFSTISLNSLNRLFGFMNLFKGEIIFKTFDKMNKSNKGSKCSNEAKRDVVKRINLISTIKYSENEEEKPDILTKDFIKNGLCVILEVLLRHYDTSKKDNLRWFLDCEKALLSKIAS
jgi:hypothetical protein